MAKITDGTFRDWQDSEIINATDYKREREILKVAANDNDERIGSIEESIIGFQLDNAQLQKITTNDGGVTISVISTDGDILQEIVKAGKGFHTFYAVSGSKNLPQSNLSIRGFAHITSVNPAYGYVKAIDYKGMEVSNYIDNNKWTGWKESFGWQEGYISSVNATVNNGFYFVSPDSTGAPDSNSGHLIVMRLGWDNIQTTQIFIGLDGSMQTRGKVGSTWSPWKKSVSTSDTQTELWSDPDGVYMHGTQTVTPTKKLSQCKNGWILVWSDYLNSQAGAQNYNFSYSYIPKFIATKHNGAEHLCSVPINAGGTHIVKSINIFDNKIEGTSGNDVGDDADAVLRYVVEW